MCAASLAVDARRLNLPRLRAVAGSGLLTAVIGLAGFGVAHALIITPIWSQLLGGLPFVAICGITLAWTYDQLPADPQNRWLLSGARFGALLLLTLLPATALDTALRIAATRRGDDLETAAAVVLTAAAGAALGWIWRRQRSTAWTFAAAAVALLLTTHGPLPVAQSSKGLWLSLAIFPITLIATVGIAAVHRLVPLDPA